MAKFGHDKHAHAELKDKSEHHSHLDGSHSALMKKGHHHAGLKGKARPAGLDKSGGKGGHFMVSGSNVHALGSKGAKGKVV